MNLALQFSTFQLEAGCDEAGRGCLAGPVVAAAVILPQDKKIEGLDDSKKLTKKQREILRIQIEKHAVAWAVAFVDETKIDEINILNASILAMQKAVAQLSVVPDFLAIDGNRFKNYKDIPHECVVKGDGKYQNIAAASILAKTHRDDFMLRLHIDFPQYNWDKNQGYPTQKHREAIIKHGITSFHRKSFRLYPAQYQLDL